MGLRPSSWSLLKAIDYETNSVFLATPVDVFSKIVSDLSLPVTCLPLTAAFSGGFVRVLISWMLFLRRLRPDKIILAEGEFRDFALAPALAAFAIAPGNVWMMALHPARSLPGKTPGSLWIHFAGLARTREGLAHERRSIRQPRSQGPTRARLRLRPGENYSRLQWH